jgi:general stress protein 26
MSRSDETTKESIMAVTDLNELWDKVREAKIGMFTTVDGSGHLTSRPMTSLEVDADGVLWFFSSIESKIAEDLSRESRANISFAEPSDSFYSSLSGHAELIADRAQYEKLWKPMYKAWFPRGLDDPQLVLIRFTVESAEYWDSDSSRMVQLLKMIKAAVTHQKPVDIGTHQNFKVQ